MRLPPVKHTNPVLIANPLNSYDSYYLNWAFLIKMAFFGSAVVFHCTIHRKAVASDTPAPNGKLVACVSLFLWAGVIFSGIFIGFIYPGLSGRF